MLLEMYNKLKNHNDASLPQHHMSVKLKKPRFTSNDVNWFIAWTHISITLLYFIFFLSISIGGLYFYATTPIVQDLPVVIQRGAIKFNPKDIHKIKTSVNTMQKHAANLTSSINHNSVQLVMANPSVVIGKIQVSKTINIMKASILDISIKWNEIMNQITPQHPKTSRGLLSKTSIKEIPIPKFTIAPIIDKSVEIATYSCGIIKSLNAVILYDTVVNILSNGTMEKLIATRVTAANVITFLGQLMLKIGG